MRPCSYGNCIKDAQAVAKYTKPNQENCTKAACSKEHAEDLKADAIIEGYELNFGALPKMPLPEWAKL